MPRTRVAKDRAATLHQSQGPSPSESRGLPGLESGRGRGRGAAASSDAADLETCPPADVLDIDTLAAMLEEDLDADEACRRQKDVDEAFAAMYGDQASADETGSDANSVPAELFDAANSEEVAAAEESEQKPEAARGSRDPAPGPRKAPEATTGITVGEHGEIRWSREQRNYIAVCKNPGHTDGAECKKVRTVNPPAC